MEEREHLRLRLAREVGKLLKNRSFRAAMEPLTEGAAPFVIGLPDDTIAYLIGRVRDLGSRAYILVVSDLEDGDAGQWRIRSLLVQECAHNPCDVDGESEGIVSDDITLGTLMEVLAVGDRRTYYAFDLETIIRFITDSVQPPVPA